jgi:hypothetical protein
MSKSAEWIQQHRKSQKIIYTAGIAALVAITVILSTILSLTIVKGAIGSRAQAQRTEPGTFATVAVISWLKTTRSSAAAAATKDDLARYFTLPDGIVYPPTPADIAWASAWKVEASGASDYRVIVAALVRLGNSEPQSLRWWQVEVHSSKDGALKSPQLPAPYVPQDASAGEDQGLAYSASIATGSELGVAAQGFLDALLSQKGDIGRFTGESAAALRPFDPKLYPTVKVQSILAGDSLPVEKPEADVEYQILVTAVAANSDLDKNPDWVKQVGGWTIQYPLHVRYHDGRWEITQIDPYPATSGEAQSTPTSTATTTTTGK